MSECEANGANEERDCQKYHMECRITECEREGGRVG